MSPRPAPAVVPRAGPPQGGRPMSEVKSAVRARAESEKEGLAASRLKGATHSRTLEGTAEIDSKIYRADAQDRPTFLTPSSARRSVNGAGAMVSMARLDREARTEDTRA